MEETTWSDTRIVVKMLAGERKVTMKSIAKTVCCTGRELNSLLDTDPRGHFLNQIADAIGVTSEDITEICRLMKLEPNYHTQLAAGQPARKGE